MVDVHNLITIANVPILYPVSTTYTFGGNGLIAFTLPPDERLDTDRDSLALGFITTQSDAVLVRINSGDSDDYLEMELVGIYESYLGSGWVEDRKIEN